MSFRAAYIISLWSSNHEKERLRWRGGATRLAVASPISFVIRQDLGRDGSHYRYLICKNQINFVLSVQKRRFAPEQEPIVSPNNTSSHPSRLDQPNPIQNGIAFFNDFRQRPESSTCTTPPLPHKPLAIKSRPHTFGRETTRPRNC